MAHSTISTTSPAIRQVKRRLLESAPRLRRATTPARCYCFGIGLFLLIRGGSTLTAGAGYGLPGDGWRAILQLVLATLLLAAAVRGGTARNAVILVGLIYAAQTLLGIHMHDVLGIIPVDGRDHIVHPVIAILALIAAITTRSGRTDLQTRPPSTQRLSRSDGDGALVHVPCRGIATPPPGGTRYGALD
jgi:hypothetical protein